MSGSLVKQSCPDRRELLQAGWGLTAALTTGAWGRDGQGAGFTHDVASGDPDQRSVTLWTRYVTSDPNGASLRFEVSEDEAFRLIVARGSVSAGAATDFCFHARPADLQPGRWYFYRFVAPAGQRSPTGRTRTLPEGRVEDFRVAVMSCSNATSGWFTAYAHAAGRDDIDLILHLGDYIYESVLTRSDAVPGLAEQRGIQPPHEAITLADYRLRYASYRNDPALRLLHRRFPFVVIRDDHETANNSWKYGAKNHGLWEGTWSKRAAAGIQAHQEWLPMRHTDYNAYQIGDLATIIRIETRNRARSKQLKVEDALGLDKTPRASIANFLKTQLADETRTMMGLDQERWVADSLQKSVTEGIRWQLLAQQVVMAPTRFPSSIANWFRSDRQISSQDRKRLEQVIWLAEAGMPLSLDRWDGYPAARARLFKAAGRANANLVVLTGDSHNAWAYNLHHNKVPVGVELAGQAVSSFGLDKRFSGDPEIIARSFMESNPNLAWCDTSRRGYMVARLTRDLIENTWVFLDSTHPKNLAVTDTQTISVEYGAKRLSL
ncbi:MAG: alkaline phosphatase D family protein [Pseudomonadota bacterium]